MADVVVDLNSRRPPVHYTVHLSQWWDGSMRIHVLDLADTPEDRLRVAAALRQAADAIENGARGT